jgi:hypothetical protein
MIIMLWLSFIIFMLSAFSGIYMITKSNNSNIVINVYSNLNEEEEA